ncbi:hypothetical protein, partial [Acidovorax sp. SD340]
MAISWIGNIAHWASTRAIAKLEASGCAGRYAAALVGFFLALVLHEKIDLERIALFSTSLNCASAVGVRLRGETATA